jgi:hypothetical protein
LTSILSVPSTELRLIADRPQAPPDHVALDTDRIDRFCRKAQVLASLNQPHIGQIYARRTSTSLAVT